MPGAANDPQHHTASLPTQPQPVSQSKLDVLLGTLVNQCVFQGGGGRKEREREMFSSEFNHCCLLA